jgi:hypothetical protein
MRVYLDVCCLKRPFDDLSQPRIRLESEAVLALLAAPEALLEFVHGPAHDLENDQNPLHWRAARVRSWLESRPLVLVPDAALEARTTELMSFGVKNFDAFHLATAELSRSDAFCTTDDKLLAAGRRQASPIGVRVMNPVDLAREVLV